MLESVKAKKVTVGAEKFCKNIGFECCIGGVFQKKEENDTHKMF